MSKIILMLQSEIEGLSGKIEEMAEFEDQAENAFTQLKEKSEVISELETKVERKSKQLHDTGARLADTLDKVEELETKVNTLIMTMS